MPPTPGRSRPRADAGLLTALALALIAAPIWAAAPEAAAALSCASRNDLDLNGDGYDDAVVGNPFATISGQVGAGSITVLFGDADGRIGEGVRRVLTQASFAGSSVAAGDHFGWSVAIDRVDVKQNGPSPCPSILVGSPGEDVDGQADAGLAQLVTFGVGPSGQPTGPTAQTFTRATMDGVVAAGDQFGYAVAIGDDQGDDNGVFAVGAPGSDVGGAMDAGSVGTWALGRFYETVQGKDSTPGTPERGDRFGAALVAGLLPQTQGGKPIWSFLIGAPGDRVSGHDDAGSVTTFDDSRDAVLYTQDSPGVPGAGESGDHFGSSLALGEPSGADGRRHDFAVGVPGEDVGDVADAGLVHLFTGGPSGLVAREALTQSSSGVAGTAEAGDLFGRAVALRPAGAGHATQLVVGVPFEDIGAARDAGYVQTFDVRDTSVTPSTSYTENAAGTPGTVAAGNRFGFAVAAMQGTTEDLSAFSSPEQGVGSVFVTAVQGAERERIRSWVPGRGGIPAVTSGRFGWSLGGLESGS